MRWFVVACIGLGALSACRSGTAAAPDASGSSAESNGVVVHVVDGDTVVVDFGSATETVRLIGVNTPETVKPDSPVECYGPEASAHTKDLLPPGTPVRVERDEEPRDVYGRLLGYVTRTEDGLFVNDELVRDGFATILTIEPNTAYRDRFVESATQAEAAGLGLWSAC